MTELVMRNYWWPGVTRDIERYVEGCNMCQRMKNRTEVMIGKLKLSEVLEKPWTYLMVDFITKLPLVTEKNMILVACNRLSKMTYFITTTEGLAKLFRDNVQKLYELLESIVLDRRPQFAAEMTKELKSMLGIETKLLTAFYLQIDSQIERMSQELEQYLRSFIDHRQNDWSEWLALAEFVINKKIHSTTKVSLFRTNYGRELRMEVDLRRKGKIEKAIEFGKKMRKVQKKAEVVLTRVQKEIKRQVDRGRKKVEVQKVGNKIMLSTKDLVFKERQAKKLVNQYVAPYIIDKVISTNAVKL